MEWFVSMPKVELHAHLNGSIRFSTLIELAKALSEKGAIKFSELEHVTLKNDLTVAEVFQFFDLIHNLITDHDTVTRITKEVIEDFASDNVVYLELRTTPKRNDSIGMTKRSYVDAVLKGLKSVTSVDVDFIPQTEDSKSLSLVTNEKYNETSRKRIIVRLLLSIDRRETTEAAMETVKLALELRPLGVVGIDLSGNPNVGKWDTYLPALKFAREQGLSITLHCGEVEICLTSNIRTASVRSIDVHHFARLYKAKHPLVLCTDDTGVFSTHLSKEYKFAADSFGLERRQMLELSRNAVGYIFADNGVKEDLKSFLNSVAENMEV